MVGQPRVTRTCISHTLLELRARMLFGFADRNAVPTLGDQQIRNRAGPVASLQDSNRQRVGDFKSLHQGLDFAIALELEFGQRAMDRQERVDGANAHVSGTAVRGLARHRQSEGEGAGVCHQCIAAGGFGNHTCVAYVTALKCCERAEAAVLEAYLPAALSEADLDAMIDAEIAAAAADGATGMKAMGKVVAAVRAKAGPTADGAAIAAKVKSALSA